jgi:hypothetical protein
MNLAANGGVATVASLEFFEDDRKILSPSTSMNAFRSRRQLSSPANRNRPRGVGVSSTAWAAGLVAGHGRSARPRWRCFWTGMRRRCGHITPAID